jgi:hypothetical protein
MPNTSGCFTQFNPSVQGWPSAWHQAAAISQWTQYMCTERYLNSVLLRNAAQDVTATFGFVQKLSQAKNFEQVVKIQTEFMEAQMNSFNEQAKILSEIYTKAAQDAMKMRSP